MVSDNAEIFASMFSSSFDSALFPISPVDEIAKDAKSKRPLNMLGTQNCPTISSIYVDNLNILQFCITPIDFLFFDIKSNSIWPNNVI